MISTRQLNEEVLIARHAERRALRYFNGANDKHIATINGFPINATVYDKKGQPIELHLSSICNEKAWNKYVAQLPAPLELGTLAYNVAPIARDLMKWFRAGGYSDRYKHVKTRSARTLLRVSCFLLVVDVILKQMYKDRGFVDKWVENEVGKILTAREYAEEIHSATGHAYKHDKEHVAEAQEEIYRKYLSLLEDRKYVAYEPLPTLPEVPDPLAMPDDEEGEYDE